MVLATGALHEDGLADTADALGAGANRERALEIMRDSRIGSFGAHRPDHGHARAPDGAGADVGPEAGDARSWSPPAWRRARVLPVVMLLQPSARPPASRPRPVDRSRCG